MTEFDITGADETPMQRLRFGEALAEARRRERIVWPPDQLETLRAPHRLHPVLEAALNQPGIVSTAAAREMIYTMQRRRREREELAAHRARWIGYPLCSAAILIGIGAVLTPNASWSAVLGTLSWVCLAVVGGMWLRGRL